MESKVLNDPDYSKSYLGIGTILNNIILLGFVLVVSFFHVPLSSVFWSEFEGSEEGFPQSVLHELSKSLDNALICTLQQMGSSSNLWVKGPENNHWPVDL